MVQCCLHGRTTAISTTMVWCRSMAIVRSDRGVRTNGRIVLKKFCIFIMGALYSNDTPKLNNIISV